jgi:OmpA-OmpF porin, OOP family
MKFTQMLQLAALIIFASAAGAQSVSNDGYARDLSSDVVKNPFGLCWHTSQWTEAKAMADCDPDAAPRPIVKAVEVPVARPAAMVPVLEPKVTEAPKIQAPAPIAAAPLAPAPMPVRARSAQTITLGADASFDTGKADLKADGQAKLDTLATQLRDVSFDAIRVTGHTDNVGTDAANQRLSLRRANAVKAYLAGHGIDPAKIQTTGRGKTSPVADNKTAQGRARNRRVEVEIRGTRTL